VPAQEDRLAFQKAIDVAGRAPKMSCCKPVYVCFIPKSGHVRCTNPCLLWANSGLMRCINYRSVVGAFEHRRREGQEDDECGAGSTL
jgi:hypothetical protein